jgi:hypothetical protein
MSHLNPPAPATSQQLQTTNAKEGFIQHFRPIRPKQKPPSETPTDLLFVLKGGWQI